MQMIVSIVFLFLNLSVGHSNKDLYIFFEEDQNHTKEELAKKSEVYYSFRIDALSDDFNEYISPIHFERISEEVEVDRPPTECRTIEWLRNEYIKSFEGFKNSPVGLDKDGEVLEFNLHKAFRKIYLVEKRNGKYYCFEARPIEIEDW